MKKTVYFLILLLIFTNCKTENEVKNLDEIVSSKNLKLSIAKFIEFSKKNNPSNCITIQGGETKSGITIYFLQNYRPFLYEGETTFEVNHNQQEYNNKYSVFKYKEFDFFISHSLIKKFKIKPQETKDILEFFDSKKEVPTKEIVERNKTNRMMLRIDSKDKIIFEKLIYN